MPTQAQFESFERPTSDWNQNPNYQGNSWEDYIMAGGYDEIYGGSFGAQLLIAFAKARSFSTPAAGYRFTFAIQITPPEELVNPQLLNFSVPLVPGGEWAENSVIRVHWSGDDGWYAFRDYRVKPFSASAVANSDPGFFGELTGRLTQYMQSVTPTLASKFFDFVQSSTLNKLGYWQVGNTTIYSQSTGETDRGFAGSGSSNGNGKKGGLFPWMIAAILLKGLVL